VARTIIATPSTFSLLSAFWEQYVFSIGDARFQRFDVVLAAMAYGDWRGSSAVSPRGFPAARADAEHLASSDAAIDEAAAALRYERDLISGSDSSEWLARVGVSSDDWMPTSRATCCGLEARSRPRGRWLRHMLERVSGDLLHATMQERQREAASASCRYSPRVSELTGPPRDSPTYQ
jgi:hypothetical protein